MEHALNGFAADASQRVCILRGTGGKAFSAGSDMRYVAEIKWSRRLEALACPPHGYAGLVERFDLMKPVIAVVDGIAYGGGFEIELACDLVIATVGSSFALPEPRVSPARKKGSSSQISIEPQSLA